MFTLIIGENKSGKSAFAESYVQGLSDSELVYLATMICADADAKERIIKHRRMREGKGFITIERSLDVGRTELPYESNLLLEDAGNLLANELFEKNGGGYDAAMNGIVMLKNKCRYLTVVSNTFRSFSEGLSDDTKHYISELLRLNEELCGIADIVYEMELGKAKMVYKKRDDI
ncbi:MAG: bifunctional adenosylcobinamide kinase/adenosylcobinamide-phosphate guanylyltransferase [Lachnospiraceae bacterium]|nr:bifunctional adenosylcobinamide kinase/adenosylcobinamide-phosphate guanylyltransferase [Lachnospiraceae bacterium]